LAKQASFAQAGTPVWGVNRFRQYLLSELLEDLESLEQDGLTDQECEQVKDCLARILAHCSQRATTGFLEVVFTRNLGAFRDAYILWNGPRGKDPEAVKQRRQHLKQLRDKRTRFSHKVGRHQLQLSSELDEPFFQGLWDATAAISEHYPAVFRRLARAIRRVRAAA